MEAEREDARRRRGTRALLYFAAHKDHCSLYPSTDAMMKKCGNELAGRTTGKGTIRFTATDTLPAALVTKLVKIRMAERSTRATDERRWAAQAAAQVLGRETMPELTTRTLDVPGAVLTYDVRGHSRSNEPPLLLIAAPMGTAGFATLAGHSNG